MDTSFVKQYYLTLKILRSIILTHFPLLISFLLLQNYYTPNKHFKKQIEKNNQMDDLQRMNNFI